MPSSRKTLGIAGADESVLTLARVRRLELARLEHALRGGGEGVAGCDQPHVATEEALQHRPHQRVMRAAEDHRVDLGPLQRRGVGANPFHDFLGEGKARAG